MLKALRAYVKAAVSNFAESGMSNPLAEIVGAFTANVSFMNGACPIVIDFGKLEIAGIANAVMQELKDVLRPRLLPRLRASQRSSGTSRSLSTRARSTLTTLKPPSARL